MFSRASTVAVVLVALISGLAVPASADPVSPATYRVTVGGHGTITDVDGFLNPDEVCPVDIEGPQHGREIVLTPDGDPVEHYHYFPTTCDGEIYGWIMFRFEADAHGRVYAYFQSRLFYDACVIVCTSGTAIVGDGSYDFPSDGGAHHTRLTFGPNERAGGDYRITVSSSGG